MEMMKAEQQRKPHFLLVPYPIQGHTSPMMKLAHQLVNHGSKVTFFTTEFAHSRMKNSAAADSLRFDIVSCPDGLPLDHERKDEVEVGQSISTVMPAHFQDFLHNNSIAKGSDDDDDEQIISCVIADSIMVWAMDIAKTAAIKTAVFFVSSPGNLAMVLQIPSLIQSGIIHPQNGIPIREEEIELSPNLPRLTSRDFTWNIPEGSDEYMKMMVFHAINAINQTVLAADWVICNWFSELDPSADTLLSGILPVGPLLSGGEQAIGNLWSEDSTCLAWLDAHPPGSVVYIAFGSTTKFNQAQVRELALGLELVNRPFLWVIRSDLIDNGDDDIMDGLFRDKLGSIGKFVGWAPQEKVLAHPSIACFLTHSGWNSVVEGISFGVPMLCLPYRGDHYYIRTCVCYGWKVGLELNPDGTGIVTRDEIKSKVDQLLSDSEIKANAFKWKELAQGNVRKDGLSEKRLQEFVSTMII
ncbi:UDP-glycosyltransferase 83A1 [Linum grandiflorum]